jgi:hypothetical protein
MVAAPAQPDWVTALRGGGCVIVMRHGATHQDQADTDPLISATSQSSDSSTTPAEPRPGKLVRR